MSAGLGSPLLQQTMMPNYANHIMFSSGITTDQPGGLHSLLSYHFNNNDVIIRQHRDSANSSPQSLYSSPTQSPRSVCSGSSCSAGSSGVPSPPPLIQMRSPVSFSRVSSRSPRSTPEATVASLKQQEQQQMSVSSDSKLYNILVNKRTDYEYEQRLAWDSAQRSQSRGSTPKSWDPESIHSVRDHYSQQTRSSSFSIVPQTYTDSSSQDGYRSPSSDSMSYRSPSHESSAYQNSHRDSASYSSPRHISESYSSPRRDVYSTTGSPCPRTCFTPEDVSNHSSQHDHPVNLKRTRQPSCDQPMDLSCKRTKSDDRPASRSTPSHCSTWDKASSPCPITSQQSHQQPAQSILQSILSGQRKDSSSIPAVSQWDSPSARCGTPDSYSHAVPSPFSNPQSPQSPDWDNRRDTGTPNSMCSSSSSHHPSTLSSLFGQSSSVSSSSSTSKDSAVCLAKKNLFPVTARVSDWIVKLVKFAQSLPEFQNLTHNDKVTLVLHAWARLLLLYMAETNFQFAVTPKKDNPSCASSPTPEDAPEDETKAPLRDPHIPTMRSVEAIQTFIKKCQALNLDNKEYYFLRIIALFNPGHPATEASEYIDNINSCARRGLQEHISEAPEGSSPGKSSLRYSRLLLCLPSLFSIDTRVMDTLFCRHIAANTDLEVLLKEMLHKL